MELNPHKPGNIFSQAWDLTKKSLGPALIVMVAFTALRFIFAFFLFPENISIATAPEAFSMGLLGKFFAGFGLMALLSLSVLLFIVSLTASRQEGRPWDWSMGFHMAMNKIFGLVLAVLLLSIHIFAILLASSLILGLISGGKPDAISLITIFQFFAILGLSFFFLVNYTLLPQVLLLENTPTLVAIKRASYLAKRQKWKICGFLLACYTGLMLPQFYIIAANFGPGLGFSLPYNDSVSVGITIFTQTLSVIIFPFHLAGTTIFYYRAKAREIHIEA